MSPKVGNWKIKLSSLISIKWEGYYPKLVVHEKYESFVKWTIRSVGFIGIASSLLVIQEWYFSLSLAIIIFGVTKFIEGSVLQFTTILVRPMPKFKTPRSEWASMGFAFPKNNSDPPMLGPVFKSKDHAIEFYNLMKEWNYGNVDDSENNICISLVVETFKDYSVYIYPNTNNQNIEYFFEASERVQALDKQGKSQQELVAITVFSRVFPYGVNSNMKKFVKYYKWGKPYYLNIFFFDESGTQSFLDVDPIQKYHLRYYKRDLVPDGSIEALHINPELK